MQVSTLELHRLYRELQDAFACTAKLLGPLVEETIPHRTAMLELDAAQLAELVAALARSIEQMAAVRRQLVPPVAP